jgi:hypothetical protein
MLSGHGQVKAKSIKYLNDGRFELVLTDVAPNDIMELLRCSGKFVNFQFGETIKTDRGFQDQPENGRLFTTDGSGVVQSAEPQDETTDDETISEPDGIYVCDKCGLHVGELPAVPDGCSDVCPECKEGHLIYQDCTNEDTAVEVDESIPAEPEPDDDNSVPPEMTEEMIEAVALSEMIEEAVNA